MQLGTFKHTSGARRRFIVDYRKWLCDGTWLSAATVTIDTDTATVNTIEILEGHKVQFFINDGVVGDDFVATVTVTVTDTEIKKDTVKFVIVPV